MFMVSKWVFAIDDAYLLCFVYVRVSVRVDTIQKLLEKQKVIAIRSTISKTVGSLP
jgi:hypothetical protein